MNRQLLARATENSDAPTPGYMYLDIAKNAASNPAICADIAKYLTGRLASKNNANIKFKCLKVISKTATSPYLRGQFKRCLAQDPQAMAAIKEALQYRGPPDPVRGDQPYERVRTAAKEALDSIYSDTPAESSGAPFATSTSASYGPSPHQQSFGSGNQSSYGGGGSGGGGARRMEGIGNPMFKDPRLEPQPAGISNITINNVVKEAKETVIGMIKDPLARNVDVQIRSNAGSVPRSGGGYQGASYNYPPGRNELMHQTNGEWTMKSNRGPDAVGPPPNYANDAAYYKSRDNGNAYAWAQNSAGASSGGVGGSWASAPSVASQARQPSYQQQHQAAPSITLTGGPPMSTSSGGGGAAVSDGSYEKQLIMELCPPGGMKAEPPPEKLAQFSRSVSSLNPDLVCPVLLDCLEEGQPWIIRAKALCVMEACIQHGKKPGTSNNAYADFFSACHGEIAPLGNHSRAAVREPAKRVLNMLGVAIQPSGVAAPLAAPPATAAPPAAAPPAVAPPAPVANLLDFDTTPAAPPAAPAPSVPSEAPPQAPATNDSLFGGLTMASATAPTAPPTAAPASTGQPTPPPTSGNLLGDLISAPDASTPGTSASLFGDMKVKDAQVVTPNPEPVADVDKTSSMFDNMSLKQERDASTEGGEMPTTGGSAFGFINQSTSNDSTDKKESMPPVAATMDSFDPLKNVTPNTARQMMQFSPEQMQAMAYQQMMMQQQMQMAQMMAMQQQKRGSGNMFMPMPGGGMPGNIVMQNPTAAKTAFAFMEKPKKEENHSFDFIKDAMTMEKKK